MKGSEAATSMPVLKSPLSNASKEQKIFESKAPALESQEDLRGTAADQSIDYQTSMPEQNENNPMMDSQVNLINDLQSIDDNKSPIQKDSLQPKTESKQDSMFHPVV